MHKHRGNVRASLRVRVCVLAACASKLHMCAAAGWHTATARNKRLRQHPTLSCTHAGHGPHGNHIQVKTAWYRFKGHANTQLRGTVARGMANTRLLRRQGSHAATADGRGGAASASGVTAAVQRCSPTHTPRGAGRATGAQRLRRRRHRQGGRPAAAPAHTRHIARVQMSPWLRRHGACPTPGSCHPTTR